jgi:hypothetical protein
MERGYRRTSYFRIARLEARDRGEGNLVVYWMHVFVVSRSSFGAWSYLDERRFWHAYHYV